MKTCAHACLRRVHCEINMAALSEAQVGTLRTLIAGLPDGAVGRISQAFGGAPAGAAGVVMDLIEAEMAERRAAATAFGPILPVCGTRTDGGWTAPADTPHRLWRLLAERHPDKTRRALQALSRRALEPPDMALFDELCALAASAARGQGGAEAEKLAFALELAPLVRRAVDDLPDWLGRAGGERAAVARLAYRDATRGCPEAGPLFLEILAAHLPEPWTILRVISCVMDQPSDRFVAGSELAPFGERVLDDVEARIADVQQLDAYAGAEAGAAAARGVGRATVQIEQFELAFKLSKDGPWGQRVHRLRRQLADAVEARLNAVEKAVGEALPLQSQRSKAVRAMPRLGGEPDARSLARARTLTAFLAAVSGAAEGGYGTLRVRTSERLKERLHQYVEDLLERIHAHEEDEASARAHLEPAAELYGWLTDERTAAAARRRAAAA